MNSLADPGILIAIQSISSPFLDTFFKTVTNLGHEYAYIVILLFIYWCVDRRIAHRTALLFLFSMWLNGLVKEVFATPRPSAAQGVRVLVEEHSFSFPSGHAQGGFTLWMYLAWSFGSRLFWIIAVVLTLLVGFSRMYLGAHFLVDVLGGYGIGAMLVLLAILAARAGLGSLPRGVRLLLALAVPMALFPLYQSKGSIQLLGFLLGFAVSDAFALDLIPYDPRGGVFRQAAKMLVGLAGLAGLYILHRHLPDGAPEALGYAAISVWITVAAPWLFTRLGLARASEPPSRRGGIPVRIRGSMGWSRVSRAYVDGRLAKPVKGLLLASAAVSVALAALAITYEPSAPPTATLEAALPADGRAVMFDPRDASGVALQAAPGGAILAVQQGLAAGAGWIAIDVYLAADGRAVAGTGTRPVAAAASEFSGGAPEQAMALSDILVLFPGARFFVEIQGSDPAAADAVAQAIRAAGASGRVVVGGADRTVVERFRGLMPGVLTAAHEREVAGFVTLARLGLAAFAKPRWDVLAVSTGRRGWLPVINQGLVDAARRHDRAVLALGVDDADEARRLFALGVRAVATDRLDLAAALAR